MVVSKLAEFCTRKPVVLPQSVSDSNAFTNAFWEVVDARVPPREDCPMLCAGASCGGSTNLTCFSNECDVNSIKLLFYKALSPL